jgi:hypothetical protein
VDTKRKEEIVSERIRPADGPQRLAVTVCLAPAGTQGKRLSPSAAGRPDNEEGRKDRGNAINPAASGAKLHYILELPVTLRLQDGRFR